MHLKWHHFVVPLGLFIFLSLPKILYNNLFHENVGVYVRVINPGIIFRKRFYSWVSGSGRWVPGCRGALCCGAGLISSFSALFELIQPRCELGGGVS